MKTWAILTTLNLHCRSQYDYQLRLFEFMIRRRNVREQH